jgi:hypothetical protein
MTDHRPRTPAEWEVIDGIRVIDPDGWRVDGKSFDEPISWDEWQRRVGPSTCDYTEWFKRNS